MVGLCITLKHIIRTHKQIEAILFYVLNLVLVTCMRHVMEFYSQFVFT